MIRNDLKVSVLCMKQREIEVLKAEVEKLQAEFISMASEELQNTKSKTITYYGMNSGDCVTVTKTGSVKPLSFVMIKEIFGKLAPDFLKEEVKQTLTTEGKELLRILAEGDFTENDYVPEVLEEFDPEIQRVLSAKLSGKYEKDLKLFTNIGHLSKEEASDKAFIVQEVMNGRRLKNLLNAADWTDMKDVVDKVKSAVIVDEVVKVKTGFES